VTQEEKSTALAQAKGVLLNALEQLEKAEEDLGGEPERVDLVVTYSLGRNEEGSGWHEIGGWACTSGPKWLHASLLRRAADAQDDSIVAQDDDEEDDE
jgi:hypothetical protein